MGWDGEKGVYSENTMQEFCLLMGTSTYAAGVEGGVLLIGAALRRSDLKRHSISCIGVPVLRNGGGVLELKLVCSSVPAAIFKHGDTDTRNTRDWLECDNYLAPSDWIN